MSVQFRGPSHSLKGCSTSSEMLIVLLRRFGGFWSYSSDL